MNAILVIMAAGLGSRFGEGIKQLEPVGPNNELIIDYSINDAIAVGFNKVVFIIRKDIEEEFKEAIGNRISKIVQVEYAYQEVTDVPDKYKFIKRTKPWGTAHAILCAKKLINDPFLVINADDYYGYEAYKKAYDFLINSTDNNYCMIGFQLKNTISNNGGVNRGICKIDELSYLKEVIECKNIQVIDDEVIGYINNDRIKLQKDDYVSMNMWGLMPNVFDQMELKWLEFLQNIKDEDSEFLLPTFIDYLIKNDKAKVKMLKTDATWLGITYESDKYVVKEAILKMYEEGVR